MDNLTNTISSSDSEPNLLSHPILQDCWNQIGVMGDRTCSQLKTAIHCRNCSVYSAAGRSLLDREAPSEYLEQWTRILAEIPDREDQINNWALVRASDTISAIVFRLGKERFALPVNVLQEVTTPSTIHTIPHRSNKLFLGLVNIRGETMLCASLKASLNLEYTEELKAIDVMSTKRMFVVEYNQNKWVFPVDEVHGIYRFHLNEFKDTPTVISKAADAHTNGVVIWQEKKVNCLDVESLFQSINDKILVISH
ncbi:MAG TPA: chemotaxis protein CheW [Cyanobacteria bacterium UBA11149]|nr:chemotaxis protein CheW [Cyanobacteria bacterium UBA11367]HBE56046.1 chemotaxis protein CheW [Cyanobacteria bacterium UBA11366]HBK63553.1 chemotaxis protein CheW [Cyanobacteria bacterium UBA11166]HBR73155.1 chemotaxis protein CheW [Cyanobacteria bacterium UBA11159]HBS70245.1 chemotaxis protein CheW [Cyanobacteria bacterium UBA11153]HBW89187.1 chemotaxis protein CheW [Cyanobacteria bacterium UBA11149]HCA94923.1 chemotaxis protein CheW [Cyanobacteria bacterium UBA9226]